MSTFSVPNLFQPNFRRTDQPLIFESKTFNKVINQLFFDQLLVFDEVIFDEVSIPQLFPQQKCNFKASLK